MENIRAPVIRRLARRGGVLRVSHLMYDLIREVMEAYLRQMLTDSILIMEHRRRRIIRLEDVRYALKRNGRTLLT